MKKILLLILIIILVVLFGSYPLAILSKVFEYIGIGLKWLAETLNFFGWNGLL